MAIRPLTISADGNVEVYHDEMGHGGVVRLADLAHAPDGMGGVDPRFLLLPCPVCGAVTLHPASGGGAPEQVQRLFAAKFRRHGIPQRPGADGRARPPKAVRSWKEAKDELKALVEGQDGPGRWLLEQADEGG